MLVKDLTTLKKVVKSRAINTLLILKKYQFCHEIPNFNILDYFFITQFTQKYRSIPNLQFDHQFGIGSGLALGVGYDIPLKNRKTMLTIGVEYETDSRRGEVAGIGEKRFNSSNFGVMTGIKF
jgi:hypothetical protein